MATQQTGGELAAEPPERVATVSEIVGLDCGPAGERSGDSTGEVIDGNGGTDP